MFVFIDMACVMERMSLRNAAAPQFEIIEFYENVGLCQSQSQGMKTFSKKSGNY